MASFRVHGALACTSCIYYKQWHLKLKSVMRQYPVNIVRFQQLLLANAANLIPAVSTAQRRGRWERIEQKA